MKIKKALEIFSISIFLVIVSVYSIDSIAGTFAYITSEGPSTVSVIDTSTNLVSGPPITIGNPRVSGVYGIAVAPDGARVYVTDGPTDSVYVISTATNTVVGFPITVGSYPTGVAVSPDGSKIYVANAGTDCNYINSSGTTVSMIDSRTNSVTSIIVGHCPQGLSVSRDGKVYVANQKDNTVSVIDPVTNTVLSTVAVGVPPYGVAVSPNGRYVYVTTQGTPGGVSVIDTANPTSVLPNPITTPPPSCIGTVCVGQNPGGISVTPDGSKVYVANTGENGDHGKSVSVINTNTNTLISDVFLTDITQGINPAPVGVSVTPDGSRVYVARSGDSKVSVIDAVNDSIIGSPITVGSSPQAFGNFIVTLSSPAPASIPTLSEWTKSALLFMVVCTIWWHLRRKSI